MRSDEFLTSYSSSGDEEKVQRGGYVEKVSTPSSQTWGGGEALELPSSPARPPHGQDPTVLLE